eukprot:gene4283-biopygen6010
MPHVSNTIWAVATMNKQLQPQKLRPLLEAFATRLDLSSSREVTMLLWGCASLSCLPSQLLTALHSQQQWARLLPCAEHRGLGSIAWALGQLGHVDEQLHGALLQQAVKLLQERGSSSVSETQWLCNMCWSVAVLDLQQLVPWLLQLVKACSQQHLWTGIAAVDLQQLYQTHIWLLDCQLAGCMQGLLGILTAEQLQQCKATWLANFPVTAAHSKYQLRGFAVLQQLPMEWQQPPRLEQLCQPDGVLSIDITATTAAGVQLAVEADGPWHFRWPDSDRGLMGPTLFRNRALAARGYRVVSVPWFDWEQLNSKQEQQRWLMAAIKHYVTSSSAFMADSSSDLDQQAIA